MALDQSRRRSLMGENENPATAAILIVDDDLTLRGMVAEMLRLRAGFRVLEAANGAAAQLLMTNGAAVRLLLTDLCMPVMSGLDLLQWFRAHHPGTPIVVMSGSLRELNRFFERAERVPLLVKPFTPQQLIAMVRAVLASALASSAGRSPARAMASGDGDSRREEDFSSRRSLADGDAVAGTRMGKRSARAESSLPLVSVRPPSDRAVVG